MTASPEQSARAILDIFKLRNCYAGDPLEMSDVKAQFLEKQGSESDFSAGLMYAEDNNWLEVGPVHGMQPSGSLTLTVAGFAQM